MGMTPTRPAEAPVAPVLIGSGGFGYSVGSALPGRRRAAGARQGRPRHDRPLGQHQLPALLRLLVRRRHHPGLLAHAPARHGRARLRRSRDHARADLRRVADDDVRLPVELRQVDRVRDARQVRGHAHERRHPASSRRRRRTPAHHRFTYAAGATTAHVVLDLDHHIASGTVSTETVDLDPLASTVTGIVPQPRRPLRGLRRHDGLLRRAAAARRGRARSVWSAGRAPAPGIARAGDGRRRRPRLRPDEPAGPGRDPGRPVAHLDAGGRGEPRRRDARLRVRSGGRCDGGRLAAGDVRHRGAGRHAGAAGDDAGGRLPPLLMPTVQSDVDGSYVGLDGKVAQANGWHYCSDMSLWDTYRTLNPLYDLVAPDRASDAVQSLVAMAKAAGYFPKWPIGDGEAGTMIGASAEVVVADAYVKGVRGFDAEGAYQILSAAAMSTTDAAGRARRPRATSCRTCSSATFRRAWARRRRWTIEYGQDDWALVAARGGARPHRRRGDAPGAVRTAGRSSSTRRRATSGRRTRTARGRRPTEIRRCRRGTSTRPTRRRACGAPGTTSTGSRRCSAARTRSSPTLESFFEQGKADYDSVNWTEPLSAGTHAQVVLGRQRAGHPLAVRLRARRPPRSHAEVAAVDRGRGVHGRRRRPSGQRRRGDDVGLARLQHGRLLSRARDRPVRHRRAGVHAVDARGPRRGRSR